MSSGLLAEKLRKGALISFIPIGYPSLSATPGLCDALLEGGTDVLELGIPFSDPIADGPVIEEASQRAIAEGAGVGECLKVIAGVRKKHPDVPVVVLTYYNLIYHFGVERFAAEAARAGVNAVLAADLPIDEAGEFERACAKSKIGAVFIVAPNTPDSRVQEIAAHATGFIYLMAHFGITGAKEELGRRTVEEVRRVKRLAGAVPVAVGFGISKGEHVRAVVSAGAEGAIVGSAFVKLIGEDAGAARKKLAALSKELKNGLE